MSFRTRAATLLAAITVLASMLSAPACVKPGGTEFTLVCRNAKGIEPGMPVTARGFRIGEVKSVDLQDDGMVGARIAIERKYRKLVRTDSRFRFGLSLESLIGLEQEGGKKEEPQIVMDPGQGPQAADGASFPLQTGLLEALLGSIGEAYGQPAEVTAALDAFRERVEAAMAQGEDEWSRQRPELQRQAQELVDSFERTDPELAESVRSWLDEMLSN